MATQCHQSHLSPSILSVMGAKNGLFLGACSQYTGNNLLLANGLCCGTFFLLAIKCVQKRHTDPSGH